MDPRRAPAVVSLPMLPPAPLLAWLSLPVLRVPLVLPPFSFSKW
jgi:hypothetical protein